MRRPETPREGQRAPAHRSPLASRPHRAPASNTHTKTTHTARPPPALGQKAAFGDTVTSAEPAPAKPFSPENLNLRQGSSPRHPTHSSGDPRALPRNAPDDLAVCHDLPAAPRAASQSEVGFRSHQLRNSLQQLLCQP